MSDCKSTEIQWNEFCAMIVELNYYKRQELVKLGTPHKYKSGAQWICWTKSGGDFLPECEGKLQWGKNI